VFRPQLGWRRALGRVSLRGDVSHLLPPFPQGAHESDLLALSTLRPSLTFTKYQTAHGEAVLLWTTFTAPEHALQGTFEEPSQVAERSSGEAVHVRDQPRLVDH